MGKSHKKNEDINTYNLYIKDIQKFEKLNNKQIIYYLKKYRFGNDKEKVLAKDKIVGYLQRYVISIAKKYTVGDNILDVINEGNIGLMKAMETYDFDSDAKFTTYATFWIKKTIREYMTFIDPIVIPKNVMKLVTYMPKIQREFQFKNYRQPTTEEIQEILCREYKLNIADVNDLSQFHKMSIDEKYETDKEGQEFMESNIYTAKTAKCGTDELALKDDNSIIIKNLLSTLTDREAYIIQSIYGIGQDKKTMIHIADELGLTSERIRQLTISATNKMSDKYKRIRHKI